MSQHLTHNKKAKVVRAGEVTVIEEMLGHNPAGPELKRRRKRKESRLLLSVSGFGRTYHVIAC